MGFQLTDRRYALRNHYLPDQYKQQLKLQGANLSEFRSGRVTISCDEIKGIATTGNMKLVEEIMDRLPADLNKDQEEELR